MAVDFISSCFSTTPLNSSLNVENYFEDFSIKNSHLCIQHNLQKCNTNFLDKLIFFRFCFYEKIQAGRALSNQDKEVTKSVYSALSIPSLVLDLALNRVVRNFSSMYPLSLISAVTVNLVYKKIIQGEDFDYYLAFRALAYTLIDIVQIITTLEIVRFAINALFFNRDREIYYTLLPIMIHMDTPVALFENMEDGKITTAFSKARYSPTWKNYSDEQVYQLLKENCQKFRYSVKEDMIKVYYKWGSEDLEIFARSLKTERGIK